MKNLFILLLFPLAILAAPIRVLQVEGTEWGHFAPDPSVAPKVSVSLLAGLPDTATSGHATEVLKRLVGVHRDIPTSTPSAVTEVKFLHFSEYIYNHIGVGSWAGDFVATLPTKASWKVECHAWGTMPQVDVTDALRRMDVRALRDNVVIIVALPDLGMGKLSFLPWANNIILVGSNTGAHEKDGYRSPDLSSHTWTSYSAPGIADAAACLISLYEDKGQPYTVNTIRNWLISTAEKNIHGQLELRLDKAVDACSSLLANFPTLPPQPSSPALDVAAFQTEIASLRAQIAALTQPKPTPAIPPFKGSVIAPKSLGSFLMTTKKPVSFQIASPGALTPAVIHLDKPSATITLTPAR